MKKTILVAFATLLSAVGFSQNDVTFQVNMNEYQGSFVTPEVNGTFNSWCGNCAQMTDANNDGIWDVIISLPADSFEFKFSVDNWFDQENLLPGIPCSRTNSGFTNRFLQISGDTVLPPVCWNSCVDCGAVGATSNVTFQLDMNDHSGGFTTPELNGDFNSWCGNCTQMTDANNDGVWEVTVSVPTDTIEFKYSFDNWSGQEQLTQGDPCTKTTTDASGTFTNRTFVVTGDTTLPAVCWESCNACGTTGTNDIDKVVDIRVSPNPSHGEVLLLGEFLTAEARTLNVYDLSGRVVLSRTLGGKLLNEQFNLNPFGLGVYLISIEGRNDSFTRKVVVVE